MAELPSDTELAGFVTDILRSHDLEKITLRMVMKMLAERLSLEPADMAPKKPFVRETISHYLENSYEPANAAEPESEELPSKAKKRKARQTDAANKPIRLTGLERAVVLAEPLAEFLGVPVIARSHIPKRISEYAKEQGLQNPQDKREVVCDDALKTALSVNKFTFFQLAKLVSGLVYKPEECSEELQQLAKECEERTIEEKRRKREEDIANGVEPKTKGSRGAKKQKVAKTSVSDKPRKPAGILKPMQLSDALIAVVGESQLPRPEVLKKIWVYIKENQLKDPNDGTKILCDQKLRAVFDGCETVTNMGINKYLSAHMTKIP